MSSENRNLTTGESLGKFFEELVASGIPQATAEDIVRDTAREVTADGQFSIHGEDADV